MAVNDHSYVIIGGSTKCATSSVFTYLADHPAFSRSKLKESRFFWAGDYPLKKELFNYLDGIEKYDQVFEDKRGARYRLEATPDYLYSEKTAQLIKDNLKDVKLIFIFREPVGRIISWYKFAKQLNHIGAHVTIDDYILSQLESTDPNPLHQFRAVEQCRYDHYLQKYIELFGREKILILKYEMLSTNPVEATNLVCGFLGIDPEFYHDYDFKVMNKSHNVKNVEGYNRYRSFQKMLRRNFKHAMPQFIRKPFSKAFKGIDKMYLKSSTKEWDDIQISPDVLNR